MNRKLLWGAAAGIAAIALTVGGTTYSAWSDFSVDHGNKIGADVLALTVQKSTTQKFDDVKLAPGQTRDYAFYVASRNGTSVPAADLTMTIKDLIGTENGCDSNSEAYEESNGKTSDKADPSAPCNANTGDGAYPNLKGQFADQAYYYVQSNKTSDPSSCTTSGLTGRISNTQLSKMVNVPVNLLDNGQTLAGGDGVCVLAQVFLSNDPNQAPVANNESQGDSATFDVRFDLTQH